MTVSGLVLNFVRDHEAVVREMASVTRPGGSVAAYVWDYAGGMQMLRHFWDAAVAVSPDDAKLDQAERIRLCLESHLASTQGGAIELTARAWAVQGVVP